jgi:hypothetical protein
MPVVRRRLGERVQVDSKRPLWTNALETQLRPYKDRAEPIEMRPCRGWLGAAPHSQSRAYGF